MKWLLPALVLAASAVVPSASAAAVCPPPDPITFAPPVYVDETRAGGEPVVATAKDGSLILGAHASTSLLNPPGIGGDTTTSYIEPYRGQTYLYRSADHGKTWTYIDRTLPPNGVPLSGFSDPDIGVDVSGNVFTAEINLTNVSLSRSSDNGKSYTLQTPIALVLADREWIEGDAPNVVYMAANADLGSPSAGVPTVGHYMFRSTDGGATFPIAVRDFEDSAEGAGDIVIDRRTGTLFEGHIDSNNGALSIAAFRKARAGDMAYDVHPITTGTGMVGHWPALAVDRTGTLYVTWDENGAGAAKRHAGIWLASSTDEGRTWTPPLRIDPDDSLDIWPWITAGDAGRVAVAWLGSDRPLPGNDPEAPGDYGWNIRVAHSLAARGCGPGTTPTFRVTNATPSPMHRGVICQEGTACVALGLDRRLGDLFTMALDGQGHVYIAYSDTRKPGPVALAAVSSQNGGPLFVGGSAASAPTPAPNAPRAVIPVTGARSRDAVGMGALLLIVALLGRGRARRQIAR